MTPVQRRLVLHCAAFAVIEPRIDSTAHVERVALMRRLAALRDDGWPDLLAPLCAAVIALSDAFCAKDGSRLLRARLGLREEMAHYLDICAAADMARERRAQ